MAPDRPVFRYRDDVLAELWTYGVRPTEHTPPELVRGFINDLYRHELRRLRDRLLRRTSSPNASTSTAWSRSASGTASWRLRPREWVIPSG